MSRLIKLPFYVQTLFAMLVGAVLGIVFGEAVSPLAKIALALIWVVKMIAVPLLFFAILETAMRAQFHGRSIFWLFLIASINGLCAITIALTISNVLSPGSAMTLEISPEAKAKFYEGLGSIRFDKGATTGVLKMLMSSPMMGAILFSLLLGAVFLLARKAFLSSRNEIYFTRISDGVTLLLKLWMRVIHGVILFIPLAVLGAVAKVTAQYGKDLAAGLFIYFVTCVGGMLVQILLVYHSWIVLVSKRTLRQFWRAAREPVVHAFGINSSLATLPITLDSLEKLGVSDEAARLSACVGTNFNNDGILLYEVVAALFIARAYGLDFSFTQQLLIAVICVVATIGVGGIPEAGIISLTLVLTAINLPAEGLTLLLAVDWIVARCRSSTNVVADMAVGIGIDILSVKNPARVGVKSVHQRSESRV